MFEFILSKKKKWPLVLRVLFVAALWISVGGVAYAFANHAGSVSQNATAPTQPAIAATWGYNTNTFWEDFNNFNGIDLYDSFRSGFNWYMIGYVYNGTPNNTPTNSFTIGNSINTILETGSTGGYLTSEGYIGTTPPRTVGQTFKNGGYFEARIAFNPAQKTWPGTGSSIGCMAFWLQDEQVNLDQTDNVSTGLPRTEIDIMEYCAFLSTADFDLHIWSGPYTSSQAFVNNYNLSDFTQFHKYGVLWVPAAKNGGTGIIQQYIDGAAYGSQFTYTSSDAFYALDTSSLGMNMMLGSPVGWPMQVDYVQVWQ